MPQADAVLRERLVNGERCLVLGGTVLVKSKSVADGWNVVEAGRCSCLGFQNRGICRHLPAALDAIYEAQLAARQRCLPVLLESGE